MRAFFTISLFFFLLQAQSQVGIGTISPDPSSALDIESTDAGILVPRMTEAQRTAIITPATGLLVYQTNNTTGFWYFDGIQWINLDSNPSWDLEGNTGTTAGVNFIGTTDDNDLIFKRNNVVSGTLGATNSAFGVSTLSSLTNGDNNVAIGTNALQNITTADGNTAIGYQSLQNTNANSNTGLGYQSLSGNSTGIGNVALGARAMYLNDKGDSNVAIGPYAMGSATNGSDYNVAIGTYTLNQCSTGDRNVAIGFQPLADNTTGSNNIGIGYFALTDNLDGDHNVSIGAFAMQNRTTGDFNIALGRYTLRYNNANDNTAVGHGAMFNNTSGEGNTAIGRQAMNGNIDGSYNVIVGLRTMENSSTGTGNVVIGYNSDVIDGDYNTLVGTTCGGELGQNNILLGYQAVPSAIGVSNEVTIGNSSITNARIQVAWTITSDEHWKKDIQDLRYGTKLISMLRPVEYKRKNDSSQLKELGFIAQDVDQVFHELDLKDMGMLRKNENGYFELRYNDFIPIMVKALQEQQEIIENQEEKLEILEARISRLEALLLQK